MAGLLGAPDPALPHPTGWGPPTPLSPIPAAHCPHPHAATPAPTAGRRACRRHHRPGTLPENSLFIYAR